MTYRIVLANRHDHPSWESQSNRSRTATTSTPRHDSTPRTDIEFVDIVKYCNNQVSNTKYTPLNFIFKNLLQQFSLHINRYFLFIACLQLFSQLTPVNPVTTWGPLLVIFAVSAVKELLDDLARAKQDKIANHRRCTVVRAGQPVTIMCQDIEVGDIVIVHEDELIPCDLLLLKAISRPTSEPYTLRGTSRTTTSTFSESVGSRKGSGGISSSIIGGESGGDKQAICFLQTANLDGESNLKIRSCAWATRHLSEEEIINFEGVVECPLPNADLTHFDARMWLSAKDRDQGATCVPLTGEHFLQAATKLKNTWKIFGLAVYTGPETKLGMNKAGPRSKKCAVDDTVNRISIMIFIFQLLVILILGTIGDTKSDTIQAKDDYWYLGFNYTGSHWYEPFLIPLRFLLLNSTMIPISLKVTLDLCKLSYASFINHDPHMFATEPTTPTAASSEDRELSDEGLSEDLPPGAVANDTNIIENLGQIEFILTDKTGTLTSNKMMFHSCSLDGKIYNKRDCRPGKLLNKIVEELNPEVLDFFRNLALNNTVVPQDVNVAEFEDSDIKGELKEVKNLPGPSSYKGASPDECCLVKYANSMGIKLIYRDIHTVMISVKGAIEQYEIVQELPFTSSRKKMSVILKNLRTGKLVMYTKGADDVICKKLVRTKVESNVMKEVQYFASKGLRTLVFATREISISDFKTWKEWFDEANSSISDRQRKCERCFDDIERELYAQGVSAIEDQLQTAVPETIQNLREGGIKFWMLTGDNASTALEVATSCRLRVPSSDPRSALCLIDGENQEQVESRIDQALVDHLEPSEEDRIKEGIELTLAVGSKSFDIIFSSPKLQQNFFRLCWLAHTVIYFRVTPAQKALVVKLVKNTKKITLAIGDGGNDVAMIQEADVGVGIRGKEGLQASRAADFQLAEFRHLQPLLFVHGRYSYLRTGLVAQYSFYKSFMFCWIQIAFAFVSDFSGSSLFNSLSITMYNAVLFFPIVFFVLNKDLPIKVVERSPQVYRQTTKISPLRKEAMLFHFGKGFIQATILFIFLIFCRGPSYHNQSNGSGSDLDTLGLLAFLSYLWIQAITMTLLIQSITFMNLAMIWGFHFLTFLIFLLTSGVHNPLFDSLNGYWATMVALNDGQFWLVTLLIVAATVLPFVALDAYMFNYSPSLVDEMRYALRVEKSELDDLESGMEVPSRTSSQRSISIWRKGASRVGLLSGSPVKVSIPLLDKHYDDDDEEGGGSSSSGGDYGRSSGVSSEGESDVYYYSSDDSKGSTRLPGKRLSLVVN